MNKKNDHSSSRMVQGLAFVFLMPSSCFFWGLPKNESTRIECPNQSSVLVNIKGPNTLQLWDLKNGQLIKQLDRILLWVGNKETILLSDEKGRLSLMDLNESVEEIPINYKFESNDLFCFSSDDKILIQAKSDGAIEVVNRQQPNNRKKIDIKDSIGILKIDPTNRYFVFCRQGDETTCGKEIELWDLETNGLKQISFKKIAEEGIRSISFMDGGRVLAIEDLDGKIADGNSDLSYKGWIYNFTDGKTLKDRESYWWKAEELVKSGKFTDQSVEYSFALVEHLDEFIEYSKLDRNVVLLRNSGGVGLVDLDRRALSVLETNHCESCSFQLLVPEIYYTIEPKRHLIVTTAMEAINIWDFRTQKQLRKIDQIEAGATYVSFCSDGSVLASSHENGEIHIWDSSTWEEIRVLNPN